MATKMISKQNKPISHDEFMKRITPYLNPYVKITGSYVNSKTKIQCLCKLCGKELWITSSNLRLGHGCASCMNRLNNPVKTHEMFMNDFEKTNQPIKFLSEYTGAHDYITCQCLICNHIWQGTPTNLLKGVGCPECAKIIRGKKRKLTTKEYKKRLNNIYGEDIIVLDRYIDIFTPLKHKCTKCNYIWQTDPHHMLKNRRGCPNCSWSYGEQSILRFLNEHNIVYETHKTFNDLTGVKNGLLSYDFYLPEYNKLIEFQGEQHEHSVDWFGGEEQFKIQQEHDQRKRKYADDHKIFLLEIWYYDYEHIDSILKVFLNLESVETVMAA